MNLFIRIIIVWLKSKFAASVSLVDPVVTQSSVWFTDQDAFRHMTNSRYFSLTDVCIIDYMLRTGSWPKMAKRGWLPIIAYEDMRFRKMLRFPQKFQVTTRVRGWTEEYVVLTHVFERKKDGIVTAEGGTVARFVSTKGERVPVSTVVETVEPGLKSPTLDAFCYELLGRIEAEPHANDRLAAE